MQSPLYRDPKEAPEIFLPPIHTSPVLVELFLAGMGSRTVEKFPLNFARARLLCAELMKEGLHQPHYFVTRDGTRADSNEKLEAAVEDFIARKDERQVSALLGLWPSMNQLASSASVPSRLKGLSQLWDASLRPLLQPSVCANCLPTLASCLRSGHREVTALALASCAALATNPVNWTAMGKNGVLAAACSPETLKCLSIPDPDDALPSHFEEHLASFVTLMVSKMKGKRLWTGTDVHELLAAMLHSKTPVATDAALVGLAAFSTNEFTTPWDALSLPSISPLQHLKVFVHALRNPSQRAMRSVAAICASLVASSRSDDPANLLHTTGTLMLLVYLWSWACSPDSPLAVTASNNWAGDAASQQALYVFQSQVLHAMWEYAQGRSGEALTAPDAAVEAQAVKLCVGSVKAFVEYEAVTIHPPASPGTRQPPSPQMRSKTPVSPSRSMKRTMSNVGSLMSTPVVPPPVTLPSITLPPPTPDVALETLEAALGTLAHLCRQTPAANFASSLGLIELLNELMDALEDAKPTHPFAAILRGNTLSASSHKQLQTRTHKLDLVIAPRKTPAGEAARKRLYASAVALLCSLLVHVNDSDAYRTIWKLPIFPKLVRVLCVAGLSGPQVAKDFPSIGCPATVVALSKAKRSESVPFPDLPEAPLVASTLLFANYVRLPSTASGTSVSVTETTAVAIAWMAGLLGPSGVSARELCGASGIVGLTFSEAISSGFFTTTGDDPTVPSTSSLFTECGLACELLPVMLQLTGSTNMVVATCAVLTLWNFARDVTFRRLLGDLGAVEVLLWRVRRSAEIIRSMSASPTAVPVVGDALRDDLTPLMTLLGRDAPTCMLTVLTSSLATVCLLCHDDKNAARIQVPATPSSVQLLILSEFIRDLDYKQPHLCYLALNCLWQVVERAGVEECFYNQGVHLFLYSLAVHPDATTGNRILAADLLQLIEGVKVPPVAYFEGVIRDAFLGRDDSELLDSTVGVSSEAVTSPSHPMSSEQLKQYNLRMRAEAMRDSRKATLRKVAEQLEHLHGPCYTATLMAEFISKTKDQNLIHYGAKGVIRCAVTAAAKIRIATTGGTANLIRFVKELWNAAATSEEELEFQEEVMADSLNALMNLTTNVENQEIVGGAGIELLVDIARESINPALHVFASKTVLNLRHNARNRTRLYKTELDVKTNDWSEKFGPQSQVGLQQQQQQTAGGAANLLGLDDSADATPREEDDVFMTAVDVTTKRASSPHSVVSFAPLPSSPGVSGVDNSLARLTVSRDGAASQQKTSRSGAGNSKGGGSTQRTVSTRAARAAACRDAFDQWFSELGVADDGGLVGAPPKAVSHTGPAQAKKKRTVSKPEPARLVKRKSERQKLLSEVEIEAALAADDARQAQEEPVERELANRKGGLLVTSRPLLADQTVADTIMAADRTILRHPDDTDTEEEEERERLEAMKASEKPSPHARQRGFRPIDHLDDLVDVTGSSLLSKSQSSVLPSPSPVQSHSRVSTAVSRKSNRQPNTASAPALALSQSLTREVPSIVPESLKDPFEEKAVESDLIDGSGKLNAAILAMNAASAIAKSPKLAGMIVAPPKPIIVSPVVPNVPGSPSKTVKLSSSPPGTKNSPPSVQFPTDNDADGEDDGNAPSEATGRPLTLEEKKERRKKLRAQRHQHQRLELLETHLKESEVKVARASPPPSIEVGSDSDGDGRLNLQAPPTRGSAAVSVGDGSRVRTAVTKASVKSSGASKLSSEAQVQPPRQVIDTSAGSGGGSTTLTQMLRANLADLWACNPNASLSAWPARANVVSAVVGRAPRGPSDIPLDKLSASLPRRMGPVSTSTFAYGNRAVGRPSTAGSGSNFGEECHDGYDDSGRMVPASAVEVLATSLEVTTKVDCLPAFRWEPDITGLQIVAPKPPSPSRSTSGRVSLAAIRMQNSQEKLVESTLIKLNPSTDRHVVRFNKYDYLADKGREAGGQRKKFGADHFHGDKISFGGEGVNPLAPFGVHLIGDPINPLAGFHVKRGTGTGAGAKVARQLVDSRYEGAGRNLQSIHPSSGAQLQSEGANTTEHGAVRTTDPKHATELNTMLTDTKRMWNRRRESIEEMHARDKAARKRVLAAFRPWRQPDLDERTAIRAAAEFLKVSVEPVEGMGLGAFKVRPPPRSKDPPPRIEDIMDAVSFLAAARAEQLHQIEALQSGVSMSVFPHVEGSKMCDSLYCHHEQPDGGHVHYYYSDRMNELIRDFTPSAPNAPLSINDVCPEGTVPLPPKAPATQRATAVHPYHPAPTPIVKPSKHSLPVPHHTCHISHTGECDAFGVFPDPPMQLTGVVDEDILRKEMEDASEIFIAEASVFYPRTLTCESQDLYDGKEVWHRCFDVDWGFLLQTPAFLKMAASVRFDLEAICSLLRPRYVMIWSVFTFYSCLSPGDSIGCIKGNAWTKFLTDAKLVTKAKGGKGLTPKQADLIFIKINAESRQEMPASSDQENPDRAFNMPEFLESLFHIAVTLQPKRDGRPILDIVLELVDVNIAQLSQRLVIPDPNAYRESRLYTKSTDDMLKKWYFALERTHTGYGTSSLRTPVGVKKAMNFTAWSDMLKDAGMFDNDFTVREAKLSFSFSTMLSSRTSGRGLLLFEDMLEAVCRMADLRSTPSGPRLKKILKAKDWITQFEKLDTSPDGKFPRRKSGDWSKPKTRPVADKLSFLLPQMMVRLASCRRPAVSKSFLAIMKPLTTQRVRRGSIFRPSFKRPASPPPPASRRGSGQSAAIGLDASRAVAPSRQTSRRGSFVSASAASSDMLSEDDRESKLEDDTELDEPAEDEFRPETAESGADVGSESEMGDSGSYLVAKSRRYGDQDDAGEPSPLPSVLEST